MIDDDQAEVDAVVGIAVTVIGVAAASVVAAGALIVGTVFAVRAGCRRWARVRGW